MIRYAIVRGARDRREAAAYLPDNYKVIWETVDRFYPADSQGNVAPLALVREDKLAFVIEGEDFLGWTLDGYVKPRYGSAPIACEEIDLSHPIMKEVPLRQEPEYPRLRDIIGERIVELGEKVVLSDGRVARFGSLTANELAAEVAALKEDTP